MCRYSLSWHHASAETAMIMLCRKDDADLNLKDDVKRNSLGSSIRLLTSTSFNTHLCASGRNCFLPLRCSYTLSVIPYRQLYYSCKALFFIATNKLFRSNGLLYPCMYVYSPPEAHICWKLTVSDPPFRVLALAVSPHIRMELTLICCYDRLSFHRDAICISLFAIPFLYPGPTIVVYLTGPI